MKTLKSILNLCMLCGLILAAQFTFAQCTTLVLQPGPAAGIDAYGNSLSGTTNYNNQYISASMNYNGSGTAAYTTGFLKFDLSQIPANATVISAKLSLYACTNNVGEGILGQPMYGVNNACNLQRITQNWSETTVAYSGQPGNYHWNPTVLPQSTSVTQDYLNVDISTMVQYWQNNPAQNYGMKLSTVSSATGYNSMIFCSSDNDSINRRPKLEICYSLDTCAANAAFTYQHTGGGHVKFTNQSSSNNGFNCRWYTDSNNQGWNLTVANTNPEITFGGFGPYKVMLIITDNFNSHCMDTVIQTIPLPVQCVTIQPGPTDGVDAFVSSGYPTTSFPNNQHVMAEAWTGGGNPVEAKGYLKFNMPQIPVGSRIMGATMDLYAWRNNVGEGYLGQPTYGSNNAAYVYRVNGPWTENTLTWNNQPNSSFGTAYPVVLNNSTSVAQDYPNIYLSDYAQGWANAPATNYGVVIDMVTTVPYNSLIFCSSDNDSVARRPAFRVCYIPDTCNAVAAFTYQSTGGNVQFTNNSSSRHNYKARWTFWAGGSQVATDFSDDPSFDFGNYNAPYIAQLVVVDSVTNCTDTIIQTLSLGSCNINAEFSYQHLGGGTVQFTSQAAPAGLSHVWVFYNGAGYITSSGNENPGFTFTGLGPYKAFLRVQNSDSTCIDTISHVINIATACTTLQPGAEGTDAFVTSGFPTTNFANNQHIMAEAWTGGGNPVEGRGYLKFDLSSIPAGATILSANLSLYAWKNNAGEGYLGQPTYGTNNASALYRITSNWTETGITWNNQPTFTTTGMTNLPQSTSVTQNYTNLNVMTSVQYWYANPAQNYGLLLDMFTNNPYNSLIFCSGDNDSAYYRPKLEICYILDTGTCNAQASFTYQNTGGNTYQFTNTSSSNNGYASDWTFIANGVYEGNSTLANPQYTFTGSPPYTAVLRIGDLQMPCNDSVHVAVNAPGACNINADFTYAANTTGTVSFTNTSTSANPVSTSWYFYAPNFIGFDINPNPHRSFLGFSGPYSATLIIVDSTTMCRDTITKNIAANIPACTANASFTYQFTGANTVAFTNTSTSNNGYTSIWTFSNSSGPFAGGSATNPVITLSGAGPYTAELEVRDSAGGVCFDTTVLQLNVQTNCITLRPGAEGIDALASQILADSSLGSYHPDLNMSQWTYGGVNKETRALLKYDLSAIPAGATITSARLSLYAATNTASAYVGQPTYGSNNASYIKQITAPWGEATVTWNNQPGTTTAGQVLLAQASNAAQSYLNINIQPFVQNWVNNPAQNYGMMMDMITTNYYNALIFGSSDNPDSTLHPKLEICYITNNQCNISAAFTSNNNSNNISLVNQSTPLDSIVQYRVQAYLPNSSTPYVSQVGSTFNSVKDLVLLPDTLINICLIAYNAGGTCTDTFCSTVFTGLCNLSASFTTISTGTTVLTYNNTTFNHTTTYQWFAPGANPSQSTATTPTFNYAQNGQHNICLVATNIAGCTDTFCNIVTTGPQPSTDTLCGMVYIDANSNGLFDFGEQPRPNSTININGVLHYTDNTGFYRAPVPSGGHLISLIAPPGWVQTFPDTPLTYLITTYAGDYICGLDFGMRDDTLILSGTVYNDNNNNGIYDAGDSPRANAAVFISGTNGNYSVTTNGLGYYSQMVFSGTYNISYNTPSGYVKTQPINPGTYTVTAYNTSITGLNFGVRDNSIAISGRVFVDANNNGIYDTGEQGIYNQQVHIGGAIVYTATNGTWGITRPAGTYNVWYAPTGNYANYTVTTPSSYTVNASVPGTNYGNNNFGVYIAPGTSDACVTLSQVTNVTPALGLAKYKIVITNYGNTAMSGTLEMNHDPLLTYHSANITPSSINTANYNVKWLVSLSVGQTVYIYPNFTVPSNAVLGTNVFNHIFYQPAQGFTDINMACNEDTLHQQVLTAYDPNDKYVSPIGQGSNHAIRNVGQKLDYTVMFQNTGNSPAVNVILLDTIEADLDMASFEMKDASHPYHLQIEGREVRWIFSNIMLPDSNTHIDSSMGFVSFSMNASNDLPDGTMVSNRAGIYFDYNDAVATGIAFNTIDKTTSISEIESGVDIALQPNPFTTYTNLIINGGDDTWPYTLQVYDMTGRVVQQATSMNNMIRIERNGMAQGIYMYEVKQNNKLIGKGKMIAE